ncbi:hypothetical protein B0H10DRAFT_2239430 [Mycena sp. CBHHK59/15]|nr:hypothetical protein B0H10DRAFT_2239430 [Mycena sp. CBHHK59/15]
MVAHQWTDDAQCLYLSGQLPGYIAAKDNSRTISLTRYWSQLDKGWFESWPEETKLGLVKLLGEETAKTKERLRSWMRYREGRQRRAAGGAGPAPSNNRHGGKHSLFKLLDKQDAKRPYWNVEIYQKMFGSKIKEEVMANGYGALSEEAEAEREGAAVEAEAIANGPIEVTVLTEEDTKLAEMMVDNLAVARGDAASGCGCYPQSRPWTKAPKGHLLAPKTTAGATENAAKVPGKRGRPCKTPTLVNTDPAVPDPAAKVTANTNGDENVVPAMTAAARAETTRLNREAADQHKMRAELRRREEVRDREAAEREAAVEAERKCLHNPAGGADLVITGSRPGRRSVQPKKNADGTAVVLPKKRLRAELLTEEPVKKKARTGK